MSHYDSPWKIDEPFSQYIDGGSLTLISDCKICTSYGYLLEDSVPRDLCHSQSLPMYIHLTDSPE